MTNSPLILFIAILVVAALLISTVVAMGYLGSLFVQWLTRFLNRNIPKTDILGEYDALTLKKITANAAPALTSIRPAPDGPAPYPLDQFVAKAFLVSTVLLVAVPLAFAPEGRHVSLAAILRLYQPEPFAAAPTPTPQPIVDSEPGVLPKTAAGLPAGNAARGKTLFASNACSSCHAIARDQVLVGPSLYGVWNTAATREPGVATKDYMFESILAPNKFVVNGFAQGLMPASFAQSLTTQQLADLLAYMEKDLSQK
ncbi:MAG TPA: c-type cytochrome [Thermoflexales bacterium]|jgi:cytochrome c2|nr:c-type cytochrome [Anaerolineae bacterium]HQV28099.1 c-type cytochrome [Thermoflexales bacterium]HQX09991.1 c-type cytochrome [Thermoflexales bacterium]HQY26487.1 c-type cytochrome [Thermoflexales bacterium]HQZ52598.1 c-type cytochrome [Thermoflexales bacterium]